MNTRKFEVTIIFHPPSSTEYRYQIFRKNFEQAYEFAKAELGGWEAKGVNARIRTVEEIS